MIPQATSQGTESVSSCRSPPARASHWPKHQESRQSPPGQRAGWGCQRRRHSTRLEPDPSALHSCPLNPHDRPGRAQEWNKMHYLTCSFSPSPCLAGAHIQLNLHELDVVWFPGQLSRRAGPCEGILGNEAKRAPKLTQILPPMYLNPVRMKVVPPTPRRAIAQSS